MNGDYAGQAPVTLSLNLSLIHILIGLCATSMSVGVHLVPIIRYAIRNLDYGQCRDMAQKALQAPNRAG